jgi:DHA2 family multidrug resistance protein
VGPTLGGWITDNYTWPWVFYVNVPVGILSAILVTRYIRDPHYLVRDKGRIDWTGLALLAIGLGALQLMLEQGDRNDWFTSSYITTLAVMAVLGLVFFVVQELHTSRPSVNLRILKDRAFTTATSIGGVLGAGLFGGLFLLPLFLQNLLGYSAMWSGVVLVPRSAAMAVIMPLGGRMYNRVGPRILAFVGLAVSAYSFWDLSHLTMDVGFWDIFWPQLWQGVGFGLLFVSLSTAALSNIPAPQMTQAAGLYNVVRQVFGSVGIALSATTLTRSMSGYHAVLSEHVTAFDAPTRQFLNGATAGMIQRGIDPFTARLRAFKLIDLTVLQQAAVLAYNHVFMLVTILFLFTLPLALLLRTRKLARRPGGGPGVIAE